MANQAFKNYLNSLEEEKRVIAEETIMMYFKSQAEKIEQITSAQDVVSLLKKTTLFNEEHFTVIYLNQAGYVIKTEEISVGGITQVTADIRVIIKGALLCNAVGIIISHNHPSGSVNPSKQDNVLTTSVKKACDIMNIKLMDHVIIGGDNYFSYSESGLIY